MHAFMMASGQQTQRQTRGGDPQLAVAAAIGVILLLSRRSSELEKFESVLGHSADVA